MTIPKEQQWTAVDAYLEQTVVQQDEVFDRVRRRADEAGMPRIEVSAAHGKMLALLAEISGARRVLEVGTLAGFSTIWMARAVGDQGQVITCEYEPRHAEVAQANLEDAGVAERVRIRLGAAEDSLQQLITEDPEPFDLIFLDADKAGNARYLELALQMARPGTVIVGDNVVRDGQILDAHSQDPDIRGIWTFLEAQGGHSALEATAVQTVGANGWDGFSLAVVRSL